MKKRIVSIFVLLMIVGLAGAMPVMAADPVSIGTAAELTEFARKINNGELSVSTNARLTDNIVLRTDAGNWASWGSTAPNTTTTPAWIPIGKDESHKYTGTFDGAGYTVSGIYINQTANEPQGLFGVSGGTIKNLGVIESWINGYSSGADQGNINSGGVVGRNYGSVSNCYNAGTVSNGTAVGGVVGQHLSASRTISNCYNTGTISGSYDVGGVVGQYEDGTISNCYNTGAVSGTNSTDNMVGGVVGRLKGEINNCYNTGMVSGSSNVGGVVGEAIDVMSVKNCYYADFSVGNEKTGIGERADAPGSTVKKDIVAFTSGEVAWLLQNGQTVQVWGQKLTGSMDALPVLTNVSGKRVVKVLLDYSDGTADVLNYYNPNDSVSIPQTADYAITLAGNPFTATNYTVGTSDATFMMTKRQTISGVTVTPYNGVFDGNPHSAVTVSGQPADVQVTYSTTGVADSYTDTLPEINEVGSVDVYVKISGFDYYDYLSGIKTATVSQASPPTVELVEKSYVYTSSHSDETIDVAALLPANRGDSSYSLGTISDSAGILDGTPTIGSDGILHYGVKSGDTDDTATIPVLITSKNYTPITVNVKISLIDKEVLTISGAALTNKAYDGSPITLSTLPTVKNAGETDVTVGTLSYLYTSTDGGTYSSSTAPTNAGAYRLVISVPSDNHDYRGSSVPITFSITPKAITITATNQSITVGSERPADAIVSPELVTGETISGVSFNCDYIKNDAVKGVVGSYTITPVGGSISSGNANYAITYGLGTLTVSSGSGGGGGYTPPAPPPVMPGVVVNPGTITFDPAGHLAVDITGAPAGSVVYYSLDGITFTTTPPAMENAGEHTVYVKVSSPGYQDFVTQTTVTVDKHAAPVIPEVSVPVPAGQQTGSTDLGALLPPNRGQIRYQLVSVNDPREILRGVPTIDQNGQLTFDIGGMPPTNINQSTNLKQVMVLAATEFRTATITILVTMENYQDTTLTVVVTEEVPETGFVGFLGETPDHYYYYDQVDLNASYLFYQLHPESAEAKMYQHYVDNHVQMVALKDGIKGYLDYQTASRAYIRAQLKEEAFDLETYLASSAAKPYETNGRPVEIVDTDGQVVN